MELRDMTVDKLLIGQYLQDKKIAASFAQYYDLFRKYRSDYQIDEILGGKAIDSIRQRALAAKFDERLALVGLMPGYVAPGCAAGDGSGCSCYAAYD